VTTILRHDYPADISIRADGTGRTVHGIVVPYGQEAEVADVVSGRVVRYRERFLPGAFERDLAARNGRPLKLLYQHDPNDLLGVSIELREDAAGLYGAFKVSNTARGNDILELLRDGALDSFSVSFRPVTPGPKDPIPASGLVERVKASLRESSLVTFPAYAGALVAGLRGLDDDFPPATADEPPADAEERTDPDPASSATPLGAHLHTHQRLRLRAREIGALS
jgi:uncharacterized protein